MIGGGALLVAAGAGIAYGANTMRDDSAKKLAVLRTAALPTGLTEIDCESMRLKLRYEPVVSATIHRCFTSSDAAAMQTHQSLVSWVESNGFREAHEPILNDVTSTAMTLHRKSDAGAGVTLIPRPINKAYDLQTKVLSEDIRYHEVTGATWAIYEKSWEPVKS